jgi:tetratricopeptide (TPR) repeat protein
MTKEHEAIARARELYRQARFEEGHASLRDAIAAELDARIAAWMRVELARGLSDEDWKRGLRNATEKHELLAAVDAVADVDELLLAAALHERGMALHQEFIMSEGDLERELACFSRAAQIREAAGDLHGASMSLAMVGIYYHVDLLDREAAVPILRRAYALSRESGNDWAGSEATRHLGQIQQEQGDPAGALPLLEESLSLRERAGMEAFSASALHALGYARLEAGDMEGAARELSRARSVAERIGAPFTLAMIARTEADLEFARLAPGVWRRSHP